MKPHRPRHAAAQLRGQSLQRADSTLLRVLDRGFRRAAERAGRWLVCRAGCSDCCHGPFPVTRLDVWRLRRGLRELTCVDRARADRVARRAADAVKRLRAGYPGNALSGKLHADERELDRFFERHARLACPALDPDTGCCDLYHWRPVSCRTYGPPVRFDAEKAPPCELCFRGAPADVVERCRVEPDREGLEAAILERMGVRDGEDWETLIAFALLGRGVPL